MKNRIKNTIKGIAAYQIFGGVLGIGLAIKIMPRLEELNGSNLGMVLFAGLLYMFSVLCGFILLKDYKTGLRLSLVNQVLQAVYFAVGSYAYNYVAGFKIGLGIHFVPEWLIKVNLSVSSFQFFLNTETGKVFVGINLIALGLVILIEKLKETAI